MSGNISIIKIFGAGNVGATTNDINSVDIPEDGEIFAVHGHIFALAMNADDQARGELSFLSMNQIGSNDARGSIFEILTATSNLTTSGMGPGGAMAQLVLPSGGGIPVVAGERIHVHTLASAGVSPTVTFMMYLNFFRSKTSRRRR